MSRRELAPAPEGRLVENIAHFGRALRRAGLSVGPHRHLTAIEAIKVLGWQSREDLRDALRGVYVSRADQIQTFDECFRLFWRDPRYDDHMMALLLPEIRGTMPDRIAPPAARRASQALAEAEAKPKPPEGEEQIEIDASGTASAEERLRVLDFEQMSLDELALAKKVLARLGLPVPPLKGRRQALAGQGRKVDPRASLRLALRQGGEVLRLAKRQPRPRKPDLVVLCDISGSMAQYSRMALHFLHGVMGAQQSPWEQVHAFTFGTKLTNITRQLRARDVDLALNAAGAEAQDWRGGTRMAEALHRFNRDWSRRVMAQGAVVLLITDGLERGDPEALGAEMARLHLTARRVIWLNPLLRFDGFAPKARGIRAMLPHVDALRGGHSIASFQGLAEALSDPNEGTERQRLKEWLHESA